jgi:hypothetical protein
MSETTTIACPYCGAATIIGTHTANFRRGAKVLAVDVQHRECPGGHPGPDGAVPFRFEDPTLLRANDAVARRAWQARYKEPMPAAARPGRKPREPRTVRLTVLLTEAEAEALDADRGATSRAEYVRNVVFEAAR